MSDLSRLLKNLRSYPDTIQGMVEKQLKNRGISDQKILETFGKVDRKFFIPPKYHSLAYADQPVTIGHGQTISQPYVVAFMTEVLDIKENMKVLEIGTGCGYQTAILAELAQQVFSIEVIPELIEQARRNLQNAHIENAEIFHKNGREGLPEHAPFDRIIVTAGSEDIPPKLLEQLSENSKMIIPVGPHHDAQDLILITKKNHKIKQQSVLPVMEQV